MKRKMTQRKDRHTAGPKLDEAKFFKELRKAPAGTAEWLLGLLKSGEFKAVGKLPPKSIREHFNRHRQQKRAVRKLAGGAKK